MQRVQAAIAEVRRRRAEREAAGLPDPDEGAPDIFDQIEAEQTSAMIDRYIFREYGSFDRLEAQLDRELAGEVPRTVEEMIEHLSRFVLDGAG